MGLFDAFKTHQVVLAFILGTQDGIGADTVIDTSGDERWKQKLRTETRCPQAEVVLFREDQWRMPAARTHADIYNQQILTEIVGGMAIKLDELGVSEPVVQSVIRGDIENLRLPSSGRVILFQLIKAPGSQLGQLLKHKL